jgi:hypothetical protein
VRFVDAAEEILREAGKPMTAQQITDAAVAQNLIASRGKTPVATMSAALYRLPPNSRILRDFAPGPTRAARGTVRWTLAPGRRGGNEVKQRRQTR